MSVRQSSEDTSLPTRRIGRTYPIALRVHRVFPVCARGFGLCSAWVGTRLPRSPTKEQVMSESVPSDRRTEADDDLREASDDVSRAADRAGDKLGDAAERAKEGATSVGQKVSDTVEDMIPGDSDQDGH